MSQEKAQLIAPLGNMSVPGVTATGVITATSLDGNIVGSAKSLVNGANVSVGVITATSFDGNLTGNIKRLADSAPNVNAGVTTASSFVGNLTGSVTDLTSAPAITVGMVTATTLEGPVTGNITGNITGNVVGVVTGTVTGNVSGIAELGLGINYNGGWTGAGTSQINAGVVTATTFYGDGSNLDGVSSGPVSAQSIGITSASTTIDLSNGNLILATQSANTTVSFANTANGNVYFVRTKDDTTTARTITWPHIINWDGGSAPTLVTNEGGSDKEGQVFLLVTRDMGVSWYGKEVVNYDMLTGYELWTVGSSEYGIIGINIDEDDNNRSSPVQIPGTDWAQFSRGANGKAIAILKSNKRWWGTGRYQKGSRGDNIGSPAYIQLSSPAQIAGDLKWAAIGHGSENFNFGSKSDGTLWAWGDNQPGQLGQSGPNAAVSSPVQIPGTNWGTTKNSLSGAAGSCQVIKTDGTLWMWGGNQVGYLGMNDTEAYSSPCQIGTGNDWAKTVDGGNNLGGAIKTNGTLWMWGGGTQGQLGNNAITARSSPIQVGTDSTWRSLTAGYQQSMATKTDGTLWTWGQNDYGELGHNDKVKRSSPTQVGTSDDWADALQHMVNYNAYAIKTNGTLWSWGRNFRGQLGHNDLVEKSSPTQIGSGTSWIDCYTSTQGGAAFLRSSS